jgi:hypothetical protein
MFDSIKERLFHRKDSGASQVESEASPAQAEAAVKGEFDPLERVHIKLPGHESQPGSAESALLLKKKNELAAAERAVGEAKQETGKQLEAVRNIPAMFDGNDLGKLADDLSLLERAGIQELSFEGMNYPTQELRRIVAEVSKEIDASTGVPSGKLADSSSIDKYLAQDLGVTRKKVAENAKSGLRECLKNCIQEAMLTRAVHIKR